MSISATRLESETKARPTLSAHGTRVVSGKLSKLQKLKKGVENLTPSDGKSSEIGRIIVAFKK